MATNIELKARASDVARQRALADQLADGPPELIEQVDTFFRVPSGRLKLRELASGRAELIYYRRADRRGPRLSTYVRAPIERPEELRQLLGAVLGIRGVVQKRRWLYRSGQTRIHFDAVDRLGDFIELEVVLAPDQTAAEGEKIADLLKTRLDIRQDDLVAGAYIDLLEPHWSAIRRTQ